MPVKFAAGAMRVAAVLTVFGGAVGTYLLFNPQLVGAEPVFQPVWSIVIGVLVIALGVVWALILWGFADGLVLLADIDDAQRKTQREVADLMLEARTARGPFHAEVASTKDAEKVVR
jgi:hypothetical protein